MRYQGRFFFSRPSLCHYPPLASMSRLLDSSLSIKKFNPAAYPYPQPNIAAGTRHLNAHEILHTLLLHVEWLQRDRHRKLYIHTDSVC
ncbi:unnamed protein product [Periconia digitata]|uniref:Uncharacterized protein n=1 Tax=Periconia digitata TaxID=1303443 RepID=A0A9W4UJV6_9PLEO|nr:unnamed protein product [Periconia digitata]